MGLLLSLWPIAAPNAQINAAIPRPDLKVGDTWTYTTFDKYIGRIVETFVVTVQKVEGDEIHAVSQAADGQGDQRVVLYTAEWNLRKGGDGRRFDPMIPYLAFPLEEGKTWKGKYTSPARDRTGTVYGESEGKVLGFESVTVRGRSMPRRSASRFTGITRASSLPGPGRIRTASGTRPRPSAG
jgi:hypothetical protein